MPAPKGLSVLVLDCRSFGGQAGASARIENYLGFPTGISGMALMGRAFSQAQKFGVEIAIPDEAVKLECGNDPCHVAARHRRADPGAGRRHRHRRPLPPARRRPARGVRGHRRSITGPRRSRRICARTRRSRWSAAAIRRARRRSSWPAMRASDAGRPPAAERDHVAISGRADRGPAECRGRRSAARSPRSKASDGDLERDHAARPRVRRRDAARPVRYLFSFIGAEPNTDWLRGSGSSSTSAASS